VILSPKFFDLNIEAASGPYCGTGPESGKGLASPVFRRGEALSVHSVLGAAGA
jgi:hypothetical protein